MEYDELRKGGAWSSPGSAAGNAGSPTTDTAPGGEPSGGGGMADPSARLSTDTQPEQQRSSPRPGKGSPTGPPTSSDDALALLKLLQSDLAGLQSFTRVLVFRDLPGHPDAVAIVIYGITVTPEGELEWTA